MYPYKPWASSLSEYILSLELSLSSLTGCRWFFLMIKSSPVGSMPFFVLNVMGFTPSSLFVSASFLIPIISEDYHSCCCPINKKTTGRRRGMLAAWKPATPTSSMSFQAHLFCPTFTLLYEGPMDFASTLVFFTVCGDNFCIATS